MNSLRLAFAAGILMAGVLLFFVVKDLDLKIRERNAPLENLFETLEK